ncbi:MAG: GNAT family N-acetyltransferase [bacterium]
MNHLILKPLTAHKSGIIFNLLKESYSGLAKIKPGYISEWEKDWIEYDNEIFQHPDTVGACGFISYLDTEIVGFASYDPRKYPTGIIGHNCILPQFRGNGYGKQQINEILRRFREMNFEKVMVSTNEHEFFYPAQRMYLACGFSEKRRFHGGENRDYVMIEYERML